MNELLRRALNLPDEASTVAPGVDALHFFVIGVTMAGSMTVFSLAFLFVLRYRRRVGESRATPRIVGTRAVETTFVSFILVLFVSIWIVGFRQYIDMDIPPDDALNVYVVARQWMWQFTYADGPATEGILYVPVNTPVKLIMTSRDVIHSFYVPPFRIKKDAVPGLYTLTWFNATRTGTYPIRCAEYCGIRHSMMLGSVVVLSQADFERWAHAPDAQTGPLADGTLVSRGEKAAADHGCLRCHTTDGSPHIGPTWTGLFGRREALSDGTTVLVDEAYLTESMMDPAVKIVAGFKPVMPSYQGSIDPGEVGAIIEYIKTLRPNGPEERHPNPMPVGGAITP